MDAKINEFLEKQKKAGHSEEDIKKQHGKGKKTARERVELLLDKDTFVELDAFVKEGVVTGYGTINRRLVYVSSQDFSYKGGSLGEAHADKIVKCMDLAAKMGAPYIAINDSGGARIQEGVKALDSYGKVFNRHVRYSGVIPQISVILGPCAGGAAYAPALSDLVFMVDKTSHLFITGPNVIKTVTGEKIDFEKLGGAKIHNTVTGCAHFIDDSEQDCLNKVRKVLSYLPSNNVKNAPIVDQGDNSERLNEKLCKVVPANVEKAYDVLEVVNEVFDKDSFFEIQKEYAKNVVVGFARLNNIAVGVVATQPKFAAGCLDINSSDKIARFVRMCNAFNTAVINLVDVPGYLPGTGQEHGGVIRHGAKVLYAYSEATVPKIALILRKAYGGAYIALASKDLGIDQVLAWPIAEIAVLGAEQAVDIVHKEQDKKVRGRLVEDYAKEHLNPYRAAELGSVDLIVHPDDTRSVLIKTMQMLMNKRERSVPRKHGNMPV